MDTEDFVKKLAEESGIDGEREELLGVENIIKVVDLERKISVLEANLGEKEKQLEKERKLRKEKEKEIERLKAQLQDK